MRKQDFLTLYACCFPEDSPQDAERMWRLSNTGKVLCRTCGGRPAAMLTLLPAKLCGHTPCGLYYIFAACTHPDFRRRGLMEALLQNAYTTALEDGMQGVFLRPASDALTRYYMQRGFVAFSHYQTEPLVSSAPAATGAELDLSNFCRLRNAFLQTPYIAWPPVFLEANYAYIKVAGNEDSLLVYETQGDALCVRELFGPAGDALAAAAAAQHGCRQILCRRFGSGEPYALARTIRPLPETYVGLTLDAFD